MNFDIASSRVHLLSIPSGKTLLGKQSICNGSETNAIPFMRLVEATSLRLTRQARSARTSPTPLTQYEASWP